MKLKIRVAIFVSVVGLILATILQTSSLGAAPMTINYTFTKIDTGDILPGSWTFDTSEGYFEWPQPLYGGLVMMSIYIHQNDFDPSAGTGELTYSLTTVGGDEYDWVLDAEILYDVPAPIDHMMIGGKYSVLTLDPLEEYANAPIASLLIDQQSLSQSSIQNSNLVYNPKSNFYSASFGNGEPSLPTPLITQSLGSRFTAKLTPYFFVVQDVTIKASNASQCPDFNGDRLVDSADLAILLGAYGPNSSALDLSNDSQINGADLGILLGSFGSCPS